MHQQNVINYLITWSIALYCFCFPVSVNAQLMSRIDCFLPIGWDGKEAKLVVNRLHKPPLIDTATVVDRHATFTVNLDEYSPAYIWLDGNPDDVHFFLDAPQIDIAVDPKAFDQPLFSGSPSSELWLRQRHLLQELSESQNKVRDDFFTTSIPTDSLLIDSLSVALVKFEPTADSLNKAHNQVMTQLILANREAASSWYLFASNFSGLPYATTLALFDKLAYFRSNPSYKQINETLSRNKVGQKAGLFNGLTMTGDTIRLVDQWKLNKVTLFDFSVSYEASHQLRHRALKKLYTFYHPLGLEIITISNALSHDLVQDIFGEEKLPWPIVLPLPNAFGGQADSPLERMSDNLLVDDYGTVIGRDMSIQALEDTLKALLNKK